jgi:membrane protein implicated in regulation of membrane protease activity
MLDNIFLIAAVIGGTILVCQFALTLLGLGHDGAGVGHDMGGFHGGGFHGDAHIGGGGHAGAGADHHGSSHTQENADNQHPNSSWLFGVLTFRTLVAAAAFFGVSGKAALSAGYAQSTSLILAILIGLSAMYGMYWLMRLISGLASSGNERIGNAVGRQATVYIPIPPARKGAGKVQLSMQNRIVEYQAVTDENETLKTGESVEVVGVAGGDIVQVRRSAQTAPA